MNRNDRTGRDHADTGASARSVEDVRGGIREERAPCSNTGRKIERDNTVACPESREPLTGGERLELRAGRKKDWHVIHPVPDERVSPDVAHIDFLAFTLRPPATIALLNRADGLEETAYRWLCGELARLFNVDAKMIERQKTGLNGYVNRSAFPGGYICWGGANQRNTLNVSLSGEGCAGIEDWQPVAEWLQAYQAKLTRVDIAHDDPNGEHTTMEGVVEWFKADGFNSGGRRPNYKVNGDWLVPLGIGRTFYIGNRENGKLFRAYEKGKQLGDSESPWVRLECEWHSTSRHLEYDMLTHPGQYLAGAYPCLGFLSIEQRKVKTIFRAAKIVFDRALHNARQHVGKLLNLALDVFGGDYAEVVERLIRREGYPKRIEPYSYHVAQLPHALAHPFGIMPGHTN